MSEVIPISEHAIQYDKVAMGESSQDCVRLLETWLELAKAGEIVSICIVGVNKDTTTFRYGISRFQEAISLMVGGLERVEHRLHRIIDE